MGAPTSSKDESSEVALTKKQTDRATILARLGEHEATRARLLESDDLDAVDKLDQEISASRRRLAIIDQRLKVISRNVRREQHDQREADRAAALAVIGPLLDQRTALATELEATLKRVVVLHDQIMNDKQLVCAWLFDLRDQFLFRPSDLGLQILRTLRDCPGGYEMLPANVRALLSSGGGGVTQVFVRSNEPDDLPGKAAGNAAFVLGVLAKMPIHPPEPADDDDKLKLEAAE